jgi:hypothetical protein
MPFASNAALNPAAYTIPEFCEAVRISRSHLFNLIRRGEGPNICKAGRRSIISFHSAIEWLQRNETLAGAQVTCEGEKQ